MIVKPILSFLESIRKESNIPKFFNNKIFSQWEIWSRSSKTSCCKDDDFLLLNMKIWNTYINLEHKMVFLSSFKTPFEDFWHTLGLLFWFRSKVNSLFPLIFFLIWRVQTQRFTKLVEKNYHTKYSELSKQYVPGVHFWWISKFYMEIILDGYIIKLYYELRMLLAEA